MRSRAQDEGAGPNGAESEGRGADQQREVLNVREAVTEQRGRMAALIEATTRTLSNPVVFLGFLAAHVVWVVLNTGIVPGVVLFDPYPFTMLATIASVEAPFIALLVLMGQRRESHISELRDEVILEVGFQAERKASAALRLLREQRERSPQRVDREEQRRLEEPIDPEALLDVVQQQLHEAEGDEPGVSPDQ